jgi:hypothetical protein
MPTGWFAALISATLRNGSKSPGLSVFHPMAKKE